MKLFELIEDWKLKIRERREIRRLKDLEKRELQVLKDTRQFDAENLKLSREAALEETKAEIRKTKTIAQPKPGTVPEKKTAFAKFQDYATNFANNAPNMLGEMNFAGEPRQSKRRKQKQDDSSNPLLEPTIKL
tara:strand:+ start:5938 stop:6336 length:399 start_codon:yes stop_codon:yes gene_type:complete